MYSFLQQTGKWWLLMLLLVMTGAVQAQTGTGVTFRSVLDGSQGQLAPFATASVEDSVYFDPSQQSKLVTPYDVRNVVTFRINEYSNLYLPAKFTATVNVHVIFTLPDMSIDSVEKSLVIDYDTAAPYKLRDGFVVPNSYHRATVRIMSVTSDAGTGVLSALMLENELQAWPVYNLSCTADAVTSISSPNPPPNVDTTDEIGVQWTAIKGADEYDLEWAYIDSTALLNNRYGNPINPQRIFENNASRVTVKDNAYRIPLLYDNGGVLYYRVRAVQQRGNARVETAWSTNNLPGGLGVYNFCGHQRNLNWQSSLTFAEEGKRKAVVQYFDGSLRSRQTVTKDNSTNTTLVSESFYDYQGRPAVTVLPAPTLSNVIKYSQNFNRGEDASGNGIEYDKDQYDHMDDPSEFLSASAKPMSKYYGANKYYSDQTPNKEEGLNGYIPDAGKYAFTETSYTQDNTNRISRQGGVGPTYKLGSNHETKYYYGTAAQKELDAIFGTEAGDETHYFKNMVRDANGQYAVTYMDMHGRTIATALAGDPDSAQLTALPSNVPFSVTDMLSGPGKNSVNDLVMESSKWQNVAVEADYNFHYELTPPVLHKDGCTANQCYKALYNLEIIITDDCNNQLLGGQPFDTTISVSGPFVADCSTPSPIAVDFILPMLKKGSYHIVKRLTISREGMEYYRDNIFLADNNCKTLDQFIQEQRELLLTDQCVPSCKSCTDSIGTWDTFRVRYMDRAGIYEDTAAYRGEAIAAYQAAVAACNELCNKTSEGDDIRTAMLLDMSAPSGQYADPANGGSPYSIYYRQTAGFTPVYKRSDIVYLDEASNPDMVYSSSGDNYIKPQDLSPEEFANAFKDSWASALLPFHPEYCKLLELEKHSASNLWDKNFQDIDTYEEAKGKGYLNPTGRLTDEFANFSPPPVADQDPLSKESAGIRQQLEDKMRTFSKGYDNWGNQEIYTIWSAATATTKCPGDNAACVRSYRPISEAFNEGKLCAGDLDMAWRNFRQFYLQTKRDIINGLVSNASCGAAQGSVPADRLLADGKHPNFNNALAALNQNGLDYMTRSETTKEQAQAKGQEELNKYYEDNCVAYSKAWAQQLAASCPFYNQAALDVIIPKLIMVCKEGSDINHTNGASSVRPASTYTYRSFADVISEYNAQHGITNEMICNAEVITAPKPYDRQPVYGTKTTYSKPEDCECSKLNIVNAEFLSLRQPADSNLSAYLLRTRKVKVLQSVLEKLLAACNEPAGSCTYLSEPLGIPGFMQCYTAPACATCQTVDSLYESFYDIYNVRPTLDESDTTKRNINQLFANFMNNRLGFAKQAWEYIRFVDSCHNVTAMDTTVCQATRQLVKNYSGGTSFIFDVIKTADNGYLLAGSTTPGSGSFSRMAGNPMGGKEAYLIKTDSKGVLQWSRIYGGTEDDEFVKIKLTSDGGYIAIGTTKSGARTASTRDAFVVKLTAEGNVTWSRAIGFNTNAGETGNDIVEVPGGGYAFTGGYDLTGGTADWLIGALTADGNVRWMKRMGSMSSDPYIVLTPKGDTLVFAAATIVGNSEYNSVVMKMNGNTGEYLGGIRYDIENGSLNRSNWVGSIFKTANGYRIPVLTTTGFDATNGSNNILDVSDNLSLISVKKLGTPVPVGGLVLAPTADGGAIVSQVANQSSGDVYLHKITAGNTIAWSNQVKLTGDEKAQELLENADGSFVVAGVDDNNAMLMFPLPDGKTGCNDSTINVTYTDVPTTPTSYVPQRDDDVTPLDMSIALGMQTYSPVEAVVNCHGFDSCYKMNNGPLLCGNAEPVFREAFPDTINQCSDNEFFAINKGTALYNVYRDSLKNSFEQDYINTALKAADLETFTVNYQTKEYHYTLYYYDQAGNLLKTVPPAGVVVNRSDAWLNDVKAARAAGTAKVPAHTLVTRYRYNTLNQVVAQLTPDAGISHFWYDRLGRLAVSQNAKQLVASPNRYSYTLYDVLGRITEVGEISSIAVMTDNISRSETALSDWITTAKNSKAQITRTVYDLPHSPLEGLVWDATNLRNRVSWTALYNTNTDMEDGTKRVSGTFYSYDIPGNVNMLLQDYNLGPARDAVNRFKKIVYDYDLVSGKVNKVSYQPGYKDQFFHRYNYDAENRLTNVQTSADGIYWENDAYYQYYKHGPLARTVLGQQQVQGLDYAYNLQGWLKGVNSTTLTPAFDMGKDGATGGITARDAFGFALHYFGERDYKPVGAGLHPFADAESAGSRFKPLFNGNIAMMSVNLPKVGEPLLYTYGYDVLNRLVKMDAARNLNTSTNNWEPVSLDDYQESISYDPNGNILTYNRNGNPTATGKQPGMDRLTYNYLPGTNKLDHIVDAATEDYQVDIKSQSAGNYGYDAIGNMTKDVGAGIGTDSIEWTVYGKIKKIVKTDPSTSATTTIIYDYDPSGNRISKNVNGKVTRYVRDASGNVMSVYVYDDPAVNGGKMSQTEVHLYGSSRLGISNRVTDVENSLSLPLASIGGLDSTSSITFVRGKKYFELSNHLGNVLATVSDVKKARSGNGSTIDHFDADLVSAQDNYPFGMVQPGRNWNIGNYRYGFNGKENDNEVKGEGGQQDYGFRIYDPRIARFLSVDPLAPEYPELTTYQFASNTPIQAVDLDGREQVKYKLIFDKKNGSVLIRTQVKQLPSTTLFGRPYAGGQLKRAIVEYNNQTYHIGFAGAGPDEMQIFELWKNYPDAKVFERLFPSDEDRRSSLMLEYFEESRKQFTNHILQSLFVPFGYTSFEGVNIKDSNEHGNAGSRINQEIKKIANGGGTKNLDKNGNHIVFENRKNTATEIEWEGALEYKVMVDRKPDRYRILRKEMGVDADGNTLYKYGWSLDHYKTVTEFIPK